MVNDAQSLKEAEPISSTDEDISTFSSLVQPKKVLSKIAVIFCGIVISVNYEQSSKAPCPIVKTDDGIVICWRDEHLLNA